VWLDPTLAYKFILEDASNNVLWTVDQVVGLLGNNSVPTAALQDGSVTTEKLADDSVTSAILASDTSIDTNRAVQTNHIRDQQVAGGKLAQSAIAMAGMCNFGLTASVAAGALTINLTDTFGATPSVGSPVSILFRNESPNLNGALPQFDQVTAALSIVIPSGATLGANAANANKDIWVYAMDNSGTVVLAVSGARLFDETVLQSCTTISTGAGSPSVLYSTSGVAGAVRLIGKLISNQATPGIYLAAPTNVALYTSDIGRQQSEFVISGATGYGSTGTMIRTFSGTPSPTGGCDITYLSLGVAGDIFQINTPDYYSITYWDNFSAASQFAITKNDTGLTTTIASLSQTLILATASTTAANQIGCISVRTYLNAGDILRAHAAATSSGTSSNGTGFRIIRG
jgi:hypothetical protein